MATVIDSLVVALGLDASGFTKGQKDTSTALKKTSDDAERTAKELEARGKQAAQFFSQIKTQVLGLFGVFTAGKGLSSFVSDVVLSDAAVGRMAKNVGMSTESFSAWQGVAERAGGSAAGMAGSIQHISGEMQQLALTGTSSMIPFLAQAHVNIQRFMSTSTPMSEKLLELSDAFKGMSPARAQALGAGMGLDQGTINVLMQGRDAVMALLAEQAKIGVTNDADAASAQRLQAAWRSLGQSSTDLGRKILTSLSPYIQMLSNALLRLSEWAATHRPAVEATFLGLAAAVTAFALVLAAPLAGLAAMSAAIGAGVVAIGLLYDDWRAWVSGGQSAFGGFWQYLSDKWASLSGIVKPIFAELIAVWKDWATVAQDSLKFVWALFAGNADDIRGAWDRMFGDLGKFFTDWVGMIKNLGPVLLDAFKSAFHVAFSWVEDRAKAVWDAITGKHSDDPGAASIDAGTGAGWSAPAGGAGPMSAIEDLISRGEGGYDSVNRGAAGGYAAGKEDLQNMTVAQVMAAQQSGKFNAAGKYQMIGGTLAAAVKAMGLSGNEKFDSGTQDRIFQEYLVTQKRKAIGDYINGKSNDIGAAIKAASMEWASIANPATGKSYYDGVGNNKASISVDEMARALNVAREQRANGGRGSVTTHDVQIAEINVHTRATDAQGVAKSIGPAVKQYGFVVQANSGLS
ncbi:hypothetical protein [Robbsia sp. KACC 23696]|uniref:hypothetical protein n=1 Tax=Robbsia sp. KACC 23696 TaxID=3149231 RepID=UPI00325BE601